MNRTRRTKLLVDRDLQVRLLVLIALASASSVFLGTALTAWSLARIAADLPAGGDFLLERLPGLLGTNAVLALVLTVPWVALLTLAGTHRIFGPLVRFRHFLRAVAEGNHPEPCRVRDGDHLKDICELLNTATEPLRAAQARSKAVSPENRQAA